MWLALTACDARTQGPAETEGGGPARFDITLERGRRQVDGGGARADPVVVVGCGEQQFAR